MQRVGFPAVASTVLAPLSLIGGWWLEARSAPGYDAVRQTISELAARDMPTSGAMNAIFIFTGLCHLVTALYTRGLPRSSRVVLALAGLAVASVALVPLATVDSIDYKHRTAGVLALLLPAIWPLFVARGKLQVSWLTPTVLRTLSAVAVGITVWFFIVWHDRLGVTGFAERCSAALGVLLPTLVVHALWWRDRHLPSRAGRPRQV